MAFVAHPEKVSLPNSLQGLYLIPIGWMKFGFEHGHLQVEDISFHDSLQGSVYDQMVAYYEHVGRQVPNYVVYDPSFPGVIQVVDDQDVVEWTTSKSGYCKPYKYMIMPWDYNIVMNWNPFEQKTFNNSLIQLLGGCKVKLVHRVWA